MKIHFYGMAGFLFSIWAERGRLEFTSGRVVRQLLVVFFDFVEISWVFSVPLRGYKIEKKKERQEYKIKKELLK